jgi:hypothetical protein
LNKDIVLDITSEQVFKNILDFVINFSAENKIGVKNMQSLFDALYCSKEMLKEIGFKEKDVKENSLIEKVAEIFKWAKMVV